MQGSYIDMLAAILIEKKRLKQLNSVLAMHDQGPVSMRRLICLQAGKDLKAVGPT